VSRRVTILYHFFHPDDVVSARHFSDLAAGLAERGWQVLALPSNRQCHEGTTKYASRETWGDVEIRRVSRPAFSQSRNVGRVANSAWMITKWSWFFLWRRTKTPEVVVVGTDPVLAVLGVLPWSMTTRKLKFAHWCFDMYPEAPIADGLLRENSLPVRLLRWLLARAYRRCDLIADLGLCMRKLLLRYQSSARATTLVPWALIEPSQPVPIDGATRKSLFGDSRLGLLYSGNFGRAHDYDRFLELARMLRGESIHFCFAVRGNRANELRAAIGPEDTNISIAGFASESELEKRLGACDLHLVSLRESWTGAVVPSKFFGAIAAGRGVVFAGSNDSAIAKWINEYSLGWVLDGTNSAQIAQRLREVAGDPQELDSQKSRCHQTYSERFSKAIQLDLWDQELRALLGDDEVASNSESAEKEKSQPAPC
jgi:colanic acid biosynthesis glycosyl transferase WcaI